VKQNLRTYYNTFTRHKNVSSLTLESIPFSLFPSSVFFILFPHLLHLLALRYSVKWRRLVTICVDCQRINISCPLHYYLIVQKLIIPKLLRRTTGGKRNVEHFRCRRFVFGTWASYLNFRHTLHILLLHFMSTVIQTRVALVFVISTHVSE
jgi:hypothetical protein